jgi:hypothetical protein
MEIVTQPPLLISETMERDTGNLARQLSVASLSADDQSFDNEMDHPLGNAIAKRETK